MTQVNIAAQSGDMGILANHVPAIEPLKAGIIEVIESAGQSKKWFGECMHLGNAGMGCSKDASRVSRGQQAAGAGASFSAA